MHEMVKHLANVSKMIKRTKGRIKHVFLQENDFKTLKQSNLKGR